LRGRRNAAAPERAETGDQSYSCGPPRQPRPPAPAVAEPPGPPARGAQVVDAAEATEHAARPVAQPERRRRCVRADQEQDAGKREGDRGHPDRRLPVRRGLATADGDGQGGTERDEAHDGDDEAGPAPGGAEPPHPLVDAVPLEVVTEPPSAL